MHSADEYELRSFRVMDATSQILSTRDVKEQGRAIAALLKAKQLHKFAKLPAFTELLKNLSNTAKGDSLVDRAYALSILFKLASLIKSERSQVSTYFADCLSDALPSLSVLDDPDDRFYLANFWRFGAPEWGPAFLAVSAVEEEGSEPVRRECIEGLVTLCPSMESVLHLLADCVRTLRFETEHPEKSKARRLRRLFVALNAVYSGSTKSTGKQIGEALRALIRHFTPARDPKSIDAQTKLAEEAFGFLHQVARSSFDLVQSPLTFAAIHTIRDWFSPAEWERFVERSAASKVLAQDIEEGLEALARVGTPDDALARLLSVIVGGQKNARVRLAQIASRNPLLSEEITAWLQGRELRLKTTLASESQSVQVDEGLANLLLDALSAAGFAQEMREDVIPEMKVLEAKHVGHFESLLSRLIALSSGIQALADTRAFRVQGVVGTVVEFSPLQHELTTTEHYGTRLVRIVRPSISIQLQDGSSRIVRKALVERA